MNVYHNGNLWEHRSREEKLTPLPIDRTFLWEDQEIFIPAVYLGKAGAVLDVCVRIPVEAMHAFLKKWDQKRRLSLKTQEDYEQIDADNPGSQKFAVEMKLDHIPLIRRMNSSLNWYPEIVFQTGMEDADQTETWKNDKTAEELMAAYHCDKRSCWHFCRISYDWNTEPQPAPQDISLAFRSDPISVTAGHFTTGASCGGETVKIVHPATGQEYTLTLHGCENSRHSFSDIGEKGVIYPEYCRMLSYSISPEIDRALFDIRDCAEGDKPVRAKTQDASHNCIGSAVGASAIFMAGKSSVPDTRTAVSSMHFEPTQEVRWRTVFQVKTREDMEVTLPVQSSRCSQIPSKKQ